MLVCVQSSANNSVCVGCVPQLLDLSPISPHFSLPFAFSLCLSPMIITRVPPPPPPLAVAAGAAGFCSTAVALAVMLLDSLRSTRAAARLATYRRVTGAGGGGQIVEMGS